MALSKVDVESGGTGLVAAGSDGNVLTSDGTDWTSAAPAGGGAWNVIATAVASSSSSLDFTSNINSTYDQYCFIVSNLITSVDNGQTRLRFEFSGGGSFDSNSNYQFKIQDHDSSGSSSSWRYNNSADHIQLSESGEKHSFKVWLPDPSDTAHEKFLSWEGCHADASGNSQVIGGVGSSTYSTAAITGIQFFPSSGNLTSGRITLYGIAHA